MSARVEKQTISDNNLLETFVKKTHNSLKYLETDLHICMDERSELLTSNVTSFMNLEELYLFLDIDLILLSLHKCFSLISALNARKSIH